MSRQIILHVGHPKTGSTSIQKNLAAERKQLEQLGFLYPKTSIIAHNHRVLLVDIFGREEKNLSIRMDAESGDAMKMADNEWTSLYHQVANSDARNVILSAEGFFARKLDRVSGNRLNQRLEAMQCDELRVLCYLRSPAKYFLSNAQQKLKGGFGLIRPAPLNRVERIKAYKEYLGVDMEARVFEREKLVNGDAVRDFLEWISCSRLKLTHEIIEANTSVSAEAMDVLQQLSVSLDIHNETDLKAQRRLVKILKKLDAAIENPTKPKLHPEIEEHIVAINTDIAELRDSYEIEFADIDYARLGSFRSRGEPRIESVRDICQLDLARSGELKHQLESSLFQQGLRGRPIEA